MAIEKKTAIITGGAGGIGSAFAKRLLQRGYRVVLADLNKQLGATVQAELGDDTLFVYCDVASWESQAEMFKKAREWGGHISLFIANAGIEEREHFYQIPTHDGEPVKPDTAVIDINLYSVIYGLRLFRHYNRESKREGEFARMFITASLAGFYPFPAAPIYSVAKHGLVGLVRSTSFKLRRDESILINAVAPGPVDTPISEITKQFVPAENFTPMKLLVESLDKIIDEDFTGRIIECSNRDISLFEFADFSNENSRFLIEDMTRF